LQLLRGLHNLDMLRGLHPWSGENGRPNLGAQWTGAEPLSGRAALAFAIVLLAVVPDDKASRAK
jgi:hypothetical protein